MSEKAQKILKMTRKELVLRERFIRLFPAEAWMWETLLGMQPMDAARFIAQEYVLRFRLVQENIQHIAERLNTNSWRRLIRTLEKDKSVLTVEKDDEFRFLMIALLESRLGRNDSYGERFRPKQPKPREIFVSTGGEYTSVRMPGMGFHRCRHCWRYVSIDPRKPSRKAPLCPEHGQHKAGTSEYNKRQYQRKAMLEHYDALHRLLTPLFIEKREANNDKAFLRRLATDKNFHLSNLPQYLHSLAVPLDSDSELMRAFFTLPDKRLSGYDEYMERVEEFIHLIFFPPPAIAAIGVDPLPMVLQDILFAESWLLVCGWKPSLDLSLKNSTILS